MAAPLLIFAGLSALAKVYSGYSKNKSLREEGMLQEEQGAIFYKESLRDANIIRHEGQVFLQKQSLQYLSSGVELGGSALITLKQTELYAEEAAKTTERRGKAGYDLAKRKNEIAGNEGTASLISGFLGGATSVLSVFGGDE